MDTKDYRCVCLACGLVHTVRAEFLSTAVANIGGQHLAVHACPKCLKSNHAGIRLAWMNGMTPEARTRAEALVAHV